MNPNWARCRSWLIAGLTAFASWMPIAASAGEPTNGPLVALGLTNVPIGEARLEIIENGVLFVHDTHGGAGVSVQLGEADSGIFLYPLTGYLYEGDAMEGKAYGRLNGTNEQFIASVHGVHSGNQSAKVTVDFSALGATRVSVFVGETRLGQLNSAIVEVKIEGNGYGSKANPWWRMPDGRFGAVIELEGGGNWISLDPVNPPPGPDALQKTTQTAYNALGNCVFITPDDATNTVEFVSRVDVTATNISSFCITDARLGMFYQRHKALGNATLLPSSGQLTVGNLVTNEEDGLLIDLPGVSRFDADLLPLQLAETSAGLVISAYGTSDAYTGSSLGFLAAHNHNDALQIVATLPDATNVQFQVRSNGTVMGSHMVIGNTATIDSTNLPGIVGFEVLARTMETLPGISLRVDSPTAFAVGSNVTFVGNEVRILAEAVVFESLESVVLQGDNLPSFTVTGERSTTAGRPEVKIARSVGGIALSWPDPNRAYVLETASSLSGGFLEAGGDFTFESNHWRVSVYGQAADSEFFRLRRRTAYND